MTSLFDKASASGELGHKTAAEGSFTVYQGPDDLDASGPEPGPARVDRVDRVDRFTLLERIGMGGMGELLAAYDPHLDRKIALKLVRSERGGSEANARLLREAQALARLAHPNVVTVYEVGTAEGWGVYVAMEYVRGQTLGEWLRDANELPEVERVRAVLQQFRAAARGLAAVHGAGLAHRDFKPDNIIVGEDGRARLIDFGLARSVLGPGPAWAEEREGGEGQPALAWELEDHELTPNHGIATLTRAGAVLGTPRYMAPEQWQAERGDARSDQFSFCVALYRALYEEWPFPGENISELREAVCAGEFRAPPRKAGVSARLQAAMLRGLASEPEARAPDMGELLAALDELLEPPRRRVNPWLLVALVLSLVLSLAAALWSRLATQAHTATSLAASFAEAERELLAERRRQRVEAEITALLAEGRVAEADAAFEAFAGRPQHAHTAALARAWLDQARRQGERGEAEAQLAALGEAQLASPRDDQRREALLELARALEHRQLHAPLARTLDELARLDEGRAPAPGSEPWAMQVREAVTRRDFAAARERLAADPEQPLARGLDPLLRELSRATLSEHRVPCDPSWVRLIALEGLDLDGDRRSELLLLDADHRAWVLGSQPELPLVHELELELGDPGEPALGWQAIPAPPGRSGSPLYLRLALAQRHTLLLELAPAGERVRADLFFEEATGINWALGDLFTGAGWAGWELWGAWGGARRLSAGRVRGRSFESFEVEPNFEPQNSVAATIAVADLDGNGEDELLVGLGGWWAYDLRVLEPREGAASPGRRARFRQLARRKLGATERLTTIAAPEGPGRWIAVSVRPNEPSPRVFPAEAPSGAPPGVHLLSWAGPGEAIEHRQHIPLGHALRFDEGDLDGDGRSELLVQSKSRVGVLRLDGEGRYMPLWLDGLELHEAADLDGDGDDELIVSFPGEQGEPETVVVLGAGEDRLPLLDRELPPLGTPPGFGPALAELWRRAEVLASASLYEQARATFAELARLANPAEAALAHRRAAELGEGHAAPGVVAASYERAGDPDSLARAVELHAGRHAFAEAAGVAARLATHASLDASARARWQARAAELRELAEPAARLELDFSQPLDDGWRLARPGLVQPEPQGLRIESLAGAPIMTRGILWEGESLGLELELELERMEWGAALDLALMPVDDAGTPSSSAGVTLHFASFGGGDHYLLNLGEALHPEPGAVGVGRSLQGALPPEGQTRFHVRLDLRAGEHQSWARIRSLDEGGRDPGAGERDTDFEAKRWHQPLAPGRYRLALLPGPQAWSRGTIRLDHMHLRGARDDPDTAPPSRRERVLLALARGEYEAALTTLDAPVGAGAGERLDERDAAWLRALVLERRGDWLGAVAAIEQAFEGCEEPAELERFAYGILLRPDRLGPTLRRLCRPEPFLRAISTVTASARFQHKDLVDLHRTLTTQLVELERYEPRDVELAQIIIDLLGSRARGWAMQALHDAAEADLRRVLELCETWLATELSAAERQQLEHMRDLARVDLAAVLIHRGRPEAAAAELERALALAATPAILADVIVARPDFESLRAPRLWARIEAAQLGLAPP